MEACGRKNSKVHCCDREMSYDLNCLLDKPSFEEIAKFIKKVKGRNTYSGELI